MLNWDVEPLNILYSTPPCVCCQLSEHRAAGLGLLHGRQQGLFDLSFAVPSECADRLAAGTADVGLVPAIEAARIGLDLLPGCGISCRGAVRSILLVSKVRATGFARSRRIRIRGPRSHWRESFWLGATESRPI